MVSLLMVCGYLCFLSGVTTAEKEIFEWGSRGALERQRIHQGVKSYIRDYPFYVMILRLYDETGWRYLCGGVLIHVNATLTACHCSDEGVSEGRDETVIIGGVENPWKGGMGLQASYVQYVVHHPLCGKRKRLEYPRDFDACVMFHKKPFKYTLFVQPIRLFSRDPELNMKKYREWSVRQQLGVVLGNGFNSSGSNASMTYYMQAGLTMTLTTEECRRRMCGSGYAALCRYDFEEHGQICLLGLESTACGGDSGGPIIVKGYVVGIVSWSTECESGEIFGGAAPREMFPISVEILLVALWISSSKPEFTAEPNDLRTRELKYASFPFYVQVIKFTKARQNWHYLCGGSLIGPSVTLTSCHCVSSPEGQYTRVYLDLRHDALVVIAGAENPWFGSPYKQDSYIKQIMAHPHCSQSTVNTSSWDVAALLHFRSFQTTEQVRPTRLYHNDPRQNLEELMRVMAAEGNCYTIGNKIVSDKKLQYVEIAQMVPLSEKDCRMHACYKRIDNLCGHKYIDAGQFCMKPVRKCIGASGGPIICKGFLFGVSGWPGGCSVGGFSIDANVVAVTHVTNWYAAGLRKVSSESPSLRGAYLMLLPTCLFLNPLRYIGF
ncbi:hypothetical protein GE061_003103 [Apolygus lucorum]|uniref:Peptidase S1 domain-containing protein n=1 Tax=Apolygus lucorum TaxID=248454 RepID=A0A6A4KAI8_APOLU|nr:hypothetical protein GE061_003103 [Apolygus lucorum]